MEKSRNNSYSWEKKREMCWVGYTHTHTNKLKLMRDTKQSDGN